MRACLLLVGHHRRHNPMIHKAKETIDSGRLGRILAVHGTCWFYKPDDYFDIGWRREKGAGPVFINLIHDVDVSAISAARSSPCRRRNPTRSAATPSRKPLPSLALCKRSARHRQRVRHVVAPWSWELTTGENPAYPQTGQACYQIGGTHASMTIPYLDVWCNNQKRGWHEPIHQERIRVDQADPLALQIRHFCRVIRGEEAPRVSGSEGLNTLKL